MSKSAKFKHWGGFLVQISFQPHLLNYMFSGTKVSLVIPQIMQPQNKPVLPPQVDGSLIKGSWTHGVAEVLLTCLYIMPLSHHWTGC